MNAEKRAVIERLVKSYPGRVPFDALGVRAFVIDSLHHDGLAWWTVDAYADHIEAYVVATDAAKAMYDLFVKAATTDG